jgi:hypothetical protein
MYIHIYTYICICIYKHIHIYIYIYIFIPFLDSNSLENSINNAESKREEMLKDPRDAPTDSISPNEANNLTAVEWETFSTYILKFITCKHHQYLKYSPSSNHIFSCIKH